MSGSSLIKGSKLYNDDMSLNFIKETDEFKNLIHAVKDGESGINISGLTEGAKPYFLAAFLQESKKKVVLILPPSSSLSLFEKKIRFFLSQFSSNVSLNILPPLSESPYQDIFPALESISSRMKFFFKLLNYPPKLVITNVLGLLKPFPDLEEKEQFFLGLEKGDIFTREHLLEVLSRYGYTRQDIISSHGEYAWRGGVVDVFSPWQSFPFRIELSGDEIASLREFKTSSQRSVRKVDHIIIPSLREFPCSHRFICEWEELARAKVEPSALKDISEKTGWLKKGNFPSSFPFQALVHSKHFVPFSNYLKDFLYIVDDFAEVEKYWEEAIKDFQGQYDDIKNEGKFSLPPEEIYSPHLWEYIKNSAVRLNGFASQSSRKMFKFPFQSVPRFENKIPFFLKYLKKTQEERERTFIYFSSRGVREKFAGLLSQHQIRYVESPSPFFPQRDESVVLLLGDLQRGFSFPKLKVTYFSEKDIFTEEKIIVSRSHIKPFMSHFQDLKVGDYVLHADYGIGVFSGLVKMAVERKYREFIEILYRDDDKLFIPVEDLNLVQKYAKLGTGFPVLNKLGTNTWDKTKIRVKKAVENMAKELLHLYAKRKAIIGYAFSAEGTWQDDFDKTFEYTETDDQIRAIKEITRDMESKSPMDRLLCGDVGYGKTEVAIRASFKAVMDGKQVAVLCPTTVLSSQHLKTFRNRMILFPVRIESLTRLQTKSLQKKIIEDLQKGLVDIIIGTHRLLSEDVKFRDLGLLIVDEEQRFGVNHKEKIKKIKANVDVLTMTATPIPRTLNMSLTGLRDISLIETPPKDRLAIHTVVTSFNRSLIASAIKKELARRGQVYFIYNRIEDIDTIVQMIEKWVPQAKVVSIHGKMSSLSLEKRMIDFIQQRYNVLVSTTIIENGIDIPLVNTLIVNRADKFGLAQLYQLRGRVGRSSRQAVAYFLVPSFMDLNQLAKERLKALQEFTELGSGFRLAARDLEIRGTGNFLGAQQHGYIEAVGFDYYIHLLGKSIKKLKKEKVQEVKTEINLKVDIHIPEDYLQHVNLRLNLYKRISSVEDLEEIEKLRDEIKDRNGPIPSSVRNLLCYGTVKYLAEYIKIKSIDRIGQKIVFKFFPMSPANLSGLTRIVNKYSGSITPRGVMSIILSSDKETKIMDETILILKELSLM